MNILLLDNDESTLQILDCFLEMKPTWNYQQFKHLKGEAIDNDYSHFDFVIADFSDEKYEKALESIVKKNRDIKTLIISDKLTNSVSEGCSFCVNHYKRKRLLKPLEPQRLLEAIEDFDKQECSYYDAFSQAKTLIPMIVNRFLCLEYDHLKQIITINTSCNSNRHTVEILSFIHMLEQNNITYEMSSENSIKLILS